MLPHVLIILLTVGCVLSEDQFNEIIHQNLPRKTVNNQLVQSVSSQQSVSSYIAEPRLPAPVYEFVNENVNPNTVQNNVGHNVDAQLPIVTANTYHNDDPYIQVYPKYKFEYKVEDPNTGDMKYQQESRDGDLVQGEYGLREPDGSTRHVQYNADRNTGFRAFVSNSAALKHPETQDQPKTSAR